MQIVFQTAPHTCWVTGPTQIVAPIAPAEARGTCNKAKTRALLGVHKTKNCRTYSQEVRRCTPLATSITLCALQPRTTSKMQKHNRSKAKITERAPEYAGSPASRHLGTRAHRRAVPHCHTSDMQAPHYEANRFQNLITRNITGLKAAANIARIHGQCRARQFSK